MHKGLHRGGGPNQGLILILIGMSMIYLICGPSGAGKTKHAQEIAQDKQAIYLSIDECMKPLSFPDYPDANFLQMVLGEKVKICGAKILKESERLLAQNREVVLDVATFQRAHRDFIRNWAASVNSKVTLHYISAGPKIRRARVLKRNEEKGKTYSFNVPEWMFDWSESIFEPPSEDEGTILFNND